MNLAEMSMEIHKNAVDHGWWDEEREIEEVFALIHSELSEALEEDRAGKPMVYYVVEMDDGNGGKYPAIRKDIIGPDDFKGEKPEGVAVEMADFAIRIMDYLGKIFDEKDCDALEGVFKCAEASDMTEEIYNKISKGSFAKFIDHLHDITSQAKITESAFVLPTFLINVVIRWGKDQGVDMEEIIRLKHAYNKTRPYKHGRKY